MSMSDEDLQKFRLFVDICCKNPASLNTEPLNFVKDFIEKFGGKAPNGELKSTEGKLPLTGNGGIKSELDESRPNELQPSDLESEKDERTKNEAMLGRGFRNKSHYLPIKLPKKQKSRKSPRKNIKTDNNQDTSLDDDPAVNDTELSADPHVSEGEANVEQLAVSEQGNKCTRSTKKAKTEADEENGEPSSGLKKRKYTQRRRKRNPRLKVCSRNCKHECGQHFNGKHRKEVCDRYWAKSPDERSAFIRDTTETSKTKRICAKKSTRRNREYMTRYFLPGENGENKRVCVLFYLSTLCISAYVVKDQLSAIVARIKESKDEKANDTVTELTESPKKPTPKPIHTNKGKKLNMTRAPRPVDCDVRCRTKCTTKISEEQRGQLCATFWAMDFKRRKDYIVSRIETHAVVSKTTAEFRKTDRPRSHHNFYFLRNNNGENVRVCLKFFTATLSLSFNYIRETLRRTDPQTGTYVGDDMRGRKVPTNKITAEQREEVKKHIESYPTWAPQKRCKMRYLHSSLNIQKMYKEYKEKCIANGNKYINSNYFRGVFHQEFRLAFLHAPTGQKAGNAKRIETGECAPKKRKFNPTISDYTGEEGGYWITPPNGDDKLSTATPTDEPVANVGFSNSFTVEPMYPTYMQSQGTQNIQHDHQHATNEFQPSNNQPLLTEYAETRYEEISTVTRLY